jgi:hypothetical protein
LIAEEATRVSGPGNLTPEAVAGMTGMFMSGGNPIVAAGSAGATSLARRAWEGLAAGGQRRLDRSLIDWLALQGNPRDETIQRLLAAQAAPGQGGPTSLAMRALLGLKGVSVPERAR